jgi:hypothetical protein
VDDSSLRFGRTGEENSVVRCSATRDQNRDGVRDLFCRARISSTGIRRGDTELVLTGSTVGGRELTGTAEVRTTRRPRS